MNVLYVCDRRACDQCSHECNHTTDISHAKNFELGFDAKTYVEIEKPLKADEDNVES